MASSHNISFPTSSIAESSHGTYFRTSYITESSLKSVSPTPVPSDTTIYVTNYLILEAVLPIAVISVVVVFVMLMFTIYHNRRVARSYQQSSPITVPLLNSMSQTFASKSETLKSFKNKLYEDVRCKPECVEQGAESRHFQRMGSDRPRSKSDKSSASYETVCGASQTGSGLYETIRGDNWTNYVNCNNKK